MFSRGRILLVDDEPLLLEMFESVLSREGYQVLVASNSHDAVSHLDKNYFDIIVCDALLEDLDGFEVLEIAQAKFPNAGCLLITGSPSARDETRAGEIGATYLPKPVGIEVLLLEVKKAYDHSQSAKLPSRMPITANTEASRN